MPEDRLAARLAPDLDALARALEHEPARAVPSRPRRFLATWRVRLERASSVAHEPALAAAAFAVSDAVPALDELAFSLRRSSARGGLAPLVEQAYRSVATACDTSGVSWLPRLESAPEHAKIAALEASVRALGLDPALALEAERVPSREPAGTLVAIERRALLEPGPPGQRVRLARSARVQVASGEPSTPRLELLEAALAALDAARPEPDSPAPRARQTEALARLAREIDRAASDDPEASGEATLRFAFTALERTGAILEARRAVLAFLQARGLAPLALDPGSRFDPERHRPSHYECRFARGEKGVVLATLETGFRDARGAVLAPAVVLVGS